MLMSSTKPVPLSTLIDANLKKALTLYCKREGLKIRSVIEEALYGVLEDEIYREAIKKRKDEDIFSLEDVLAERDKKSKK